MTDTIEAVARAMCNSRDGITCICEGGPRTQYSNCVERWSYAQAAITAHLAALEAQGMVIVPREPTDKMLEDAGTIKDWDITNGNDADEVHIDWWEAMIEAAPK